MGAACRAAGEPGRHALARLVSPRGWKFRTKRPAVLALRDRNGQVQPAPGTDGIESRRGLVGAVGFLSDGESILMATRGTNPDFQLWVMDSDTGETTRLVESLPGAIVMDYGLPLSWTASGRIFVPATIGSGTLLTVVSR